MERKIKIQHKVTFNLAHIENVRALVLALTQSGYFVKTFSPIDGTGIVYQIDVYTDRI